jgi:two-component system, LuxR family, sensor kinase FixL
MSNEFQHTLNVESAAVFANEPLPEPPKRRLAEVNWLIALATLVTGIVVFGSARLYWTGVKALQTQAARVVDSASGQTHDELVRLVAETNHWVIQTVGSSIGGTVALFLLVVLGGQWWRRASVRRMVKLTGDSNQRFTQLQSRLADAKLAEESAQQARMEIHTRLHNLTQTHSALHAELNQRKQAEKSLAQQTLQLERSKDVLEMHVTARTQELQKLQRRNELILNSAGEGICGFDLPGRVTFVNPAAARITGWRLDDMLGKTEEEIFFPDRTHASAKGVGLLRSESGDYLPEQVFYRRDGSTFPVEYLRNPINEKDKVVGAVVMFKDITERKLAEDKLAHKAAELARSNGELEQFAFVASHDLQEPLRKIQAFGDRLKLKCEAVQLEEGRDYLDRMQKAAARMQTLINDLLTFSRVISSSQPFVPVDLGAVTREVLVDLEHRIERTQARVEVGTLPTIDADPLQMRQLLQNLIGNALKFQPLNNIPVVKIDAQMVTRDQISEEAVFPKPPPTARPDDKFCVLTVQDNGIGFEEQYLDKIFAVFQRLHGRVEYEGTGVGLAVCRRITDRHGGLITAQSKPGEGAIFIVILPLRQPKGEVTK